jgi:hypothetical protein
MDAFHAAMAVILLAFWGILLWSLAVGRFSVRNKVYLRREQPWVYWTDVASLFALLVAWAVGWFR